MEITTYQLPLPEGANVILGQTHFIKTTEDLYEALVTSVPNIKFGLAFCEASGPCLVRSEGNDSVLRRRPATVRSMPSPGWFSRYPVVRRVGSLRQRYDPRPGWLESDDWTR